MFDYSFGSLIYEAGLSILKLFCFCPFLNLFLTKWWWWDIF